MARERDLVPPGNSESVRTSADLDREFNELLDDAFSDEKNKYTSEPARAMTSLLSDIGTPLSQWESEESVAEYDSQSELVLSSASVLTCEPEDSMTALSSVGRLQAKVSKFDGLQRRLEAKISAVRALQLPQLYGKRAATSSGR